MLPTLRPATLHDIPALREMLVATWHATYDATLGVEKVNAIAASWHSPEKLSAECAAALAEPEANAMLVAEHGGRVIGTASAHFLPDSFLELARLYILPECQRSGLGKALLAASIARFPKARIARLEVEPRNATAIAFYARQGFFAVGGGKACGGDVKASVEHLIMEADLPLLALRPAEDRDAQDLFGLLTLCFAEYPGCYTDPHDDMPDLVRPGHWPERTKNGQRLGGEFLVLEDVTGRVCACVAVDFPAPGIAELHRLYVRPDCRRMGIAEALVRRIERIAEAGKAGRVILWSDTRFIGAHRLYARLGYVQGRERRPLGDISNSEEFDFTKKL